MVDNRSAGVLGVGGALNFKSGDISGTAAKTSDDKMGQGTEYFRTDQQGEENFKQSNYVDRSAQLRATLNSLAMMNVANVLKDNKAAKAAKKDKNKEKDKIKKPVSYQNLLAEEDEDESL